MILIQLSFHSSLLVHSLLPALPSSSLCTPAQPLHVSFFLPLPSSFLTPVSFPHSLHYRVWLCPQLYHCQPVFRHLMMIQSSEAVVLNYLEFLVTDHDYLHSDALWVMSAVLILLLLLPQGWDVCWSRVWTACFWGSFVGIDLVLCKYRGSCYLKILI